MKFLVELDHSMPSEPLAAEAARAFIEDIIYPTLTRGEELIKQGHILSGGPVAGRVALRFIAEVETAQQLDQIISSIPLWTVAETSITPLIEFGDRRVQVQGLLENIGKLSPAIDVRRELLPAY